MTYTIQARDATREGLKGRVREELRRQTAGQPLHEADRDLAGALICGFIDLEPEAPGSLIVCDAFGYATPASDAVLGQRSLSVKVYRVSGALAQPRIQP